MDAFMNSKSQPTVTAMSLHTDTTIESIGKQLQEMNNALRNLKNNIQPNSQPLQSYNCSQFGHFARECQKQQPMVAGSICQCCSVRGHQALQYPKLTDKRRCPQANTLLTRLSDLPSRFQSPQQDYNRVSPQTVGVTPQKSYPLAYQIYDKQGHSARNCFSAFPPRRQETNFKSRGQNFQKGFNAGLPVMKMPEKVEKVAHFSFKSSIK